MTEWAKRRQRRHEWWVRVGVYIAIVLGVAAQSTVQRLDVKGLGIDLDFTGWDIPRIILALVLAIVVYQKLDGSGELSGKVKNVRRVLWLGASSGFTLMGIASIGGGE